MSRDLTNGQPLAPVRVSRILHAGYAFEYGDTQILFDPIFENPFSRNCFAFPAVEFDLPAIAQLRPDAVFISHFHDDHCSLESLVHLNRETPIYIYCEHEEILELIRALGFSKVTAAKVDLAVDVGAFRVTPLLALDPDVDAIFRIDVGGLKILNVVDAWIDPATVDRLAVDAPWDLILWPFQTMREIEVLSPSRAVSSDGEIPCEWIAQLKVLNPRYVVPSSCQFIHEPWSWYNHALFPVTYAGFAKQVSAELTRTQIFRLDPSKSVVLAANGSLSEGAPLTWMRTSGKQNVDYDYRPELKAPPTSEIAKNFPALSAQQTHIVYDSVFNELISNYRLLEETDRYFNDRRKWRLAIFDHQGSAKHFDFEICRNEIISIDAISTLPLGWLTEVPLARLDGALHAGESLTSMYVRINDVVFDPEIEIALREVDILEDPLVRCLFRGGVAAYQKAQLKRLRSSLTPAQE